MDRLGPKLKRAFRLVFESVARLENWPQALAALYHASRGRAPSTPLVLKFINGLELEMMPGGIGAYTILFPEIFCERVYEAEVFSFGDAPVIVDIGANIGFFSCKMAQQFPRGRILAIEAVPQYTNLLRKNVRVNKLDNVVVIEAAIGDGHTNAEIQYWFTPSGYLKVTDRVPPGVRAGVLTLPSTSLEQALDAYGVDQCDLLKVDIEGHEYAMFRTLTTDTLRRCRQIAMEWHVPSAVQGPRQLAATLQSAGFELLPLTNFHGESGMIYAVRKPQGSPRH